MTESESLPPPVSPDDTPPEDEEKVLFHPAAVWKFILLNVCTFGLYNLYWAYKCWKFVRENGRFNISPFWRAVFLPIWFYSLGREINESYSKPVLVLLALVYLAFNLIGYLPDPLWLLSVLSFIPLLPLLKEVNALNQSAEVRAASNFSRFGWKHIAVTTGGGLCLFFAIISSLNVIPSTQVVDGERLPEWHKAFMLEVGALEEGEAIEYFYSAGLWSLKEDGNYVTDLSVGSYWKDPVDRTFHVDVAKYPEISDISISYSDSFWEDTIATITRVDGSEFELYISNEMDRDHHFGEFLLERWKDR